MKFSDYSKDVLPVAEIFESISGETGGSMRMGQRCLFFRVSGCNLRCAWCDTPDTWEPEGGDPFYVEELVSVVVEELEKTNLEHVIITGGEPLLYPVQIASLMAGILKQRPYTKIQIETNGTIAPPKGWRSTYGCSFVVDYKPLSAACMDFIACEELFTGLTKHDTVKIVVKDGGDLNDALNFLDEGYFGDEVYVAFSVEEAETAKFCLEALTHLGRNNTGLNIQMHKVLKLA